LLLRRAQGSSDLAKLAVVVANYTSRSPFTNCLPHLKGEEVFGFAKRLIDCLPGVEEDSHCFDHVNFSCLWVFVSAIELDIVEDIHVQQPPSSSNDLLPLLFRNGLELKENICVDGQWRLECYTSKYAIQCFAFQKTTILKCKTRINFYKLVNGTPTPCYLGF
jgi:hypothetical protein